MNATLIIVASILAVALVVSTGGIYDNKVAISASGLWQINKLTGHVTICSFGSCKRWEGAGLQVSRR